MLRKYTGIPKNKSMVVKAKPGLVRETISVGVASCQHVVDSIFTVGALNLAIEWDSGSCTGFPT